MTPSMLYKLIKIMRSAAPSVHFIALRFLRIHRRSSFLLQSLDSRSMGLNFERRFVTSFAAYAGPASPLSMSSHAGAALLAGLDNPYLRAGTLAPSESEEEAEPDPESEA